MVQLEIVAFSRDGNILECKWKEFEGTFFIYNVHIPYLPYAGKLHGIEDGGFL